MNYKEDSEKNYPQNPPVLLPGGFLLNLKLPPLIVIILSFIMVVAFRSVAVSSPIPVADDGFQIAPLFTPEIQYWEHKIIAWSETWNLDPNLIATIMQIESCGNPKAQSGVGAIGLFQVMPYHFSDDEDPYKPNINAKKGLAYLTKSLEARGGDPRLAFAGYNGGITGAKEPEYLWPAETVSFVYWGTGIYGDAKKNLAQSDRLTEWLASGGESLCAAASEYLGLQK
jgi:soluble lytic murein transglycosylase-like protein